MNETDKLLEALQYALIAIRTAGDPNEVLANFDLNPNHVRAAGEGAGDEAAFATGLLTGMILERRRHQ